MSAFKTNFETIKGTETTVCDMIAPVDCRFDASEDEYFEGTMTGSLLHLDPVYLEMYGSLA